MLRLRTWGAVLICLTGLAGVRVAAQEAGTDEADAAIATRFLAVLEKSPRRGTAFDKVYGFQTERGTLDEFVATYRDRALAAEAEQGHPGATAWMIVGLVEMQRGRDADAIQAFAMAEKLDPANPMASYYLGQTLVNSGQPDEAAAAFERAISRKPATADLLEMFQALGRVYQRTQQSDKALKIWTRLEQQFPDNPQVREQIANTLLEENELDAALPRFEQLAKATRDKYRQTQFQIEAAEIKVRLGQTQDGLSDFESLLKQLNPDNWMYREVRRRIELVYLKSNDEKGLASYYESWIRSHPEDLDAISRLARLLAGLRRRDQARTWLQKGLTLAPSNKDLRQSLINLLIEDRKFHDASEQFRELDKHDANNPDTLREWGKVLLKDSTLDVAGRQRAAAAVWRRLLDSHPNDAHAALQVADLLRRAELTDDAVTMYRRAIELAPESAQYQEYLGDYLHSLKRSEEALAAWRQMATESRKNAPNCARLAEVLARHGLFAEAISASEEACRLDPKDFGLQLKHADLLSRDGRRAAALQQLAVATAMAVTDEERDACLQREMTELKGLDQLAIRIAEVRQRLEPRFNVNRREDAEQWYWLARAHEVHGQPRDAVVAIKNAVDLKPESVRFLNAAARLNQEQRNLSTAVELNTRLAAIDRRYRTEYLKRIAILEEQLGRREQALQAGRDLMAAAPGNPDANEFFAQLCFRLGKSDEGVKSLRRSLRTNPGDVGTLIRLAAVLVEQQQTQEGMELLWLALERPQTQDSRVTIVRQLTEGHMKLDRLNLLYGRLERECRNPARRREFTVCLALSKEFAGDVPEAQQILESLLTEESRDTELLTQLCRLAILQQDYESAVTHQRQLWKITGNTSDRSQLAQLLIQADRSDEALDLLTQENGKLELTADALRLVDSLVSAGRRSEALARLKQLRSHFPDNWELVYRHGAALGKSHSPEALECFETLLKMTTPDDDVSLLGPRATPQSTSPALARLPLMARLSHVAQVESIILSILNSSDTRSVPSATVTVVTPSGNVVRTRGTTSSFRPRWMPEDYGTARLAAWCWIMNLKDDRSGAIADLATRFRMTERQDRRYHIDQIALFTLWHQPEEKCEAARKLMRHSPDDVEACALYLKSLGDRRDTTFAGSLTESRRIKNLPALTDEHLDELAPVFHKIASRSDLGPLKVELLANVMHELRLAGRTRLAEQLYADAADCASTPLEVAMMLEYQKRFPDLSIVTRLLNRLVEFHDHPGHGPGWESQESLLPEQLPALLLPMVQRADRADEMNAAWAGFLRLQARQSTGLSAVSRNRMAPRPYFVVVAASGASRRRSVLRPSTRLPGIVHSVESLLILESVRRKFEVDERGKDLIDGIQAEIDSTKTIPDERLYWQHTLAYVKWVENDQEAALKILAEALKEVPSRDDLRLGLAKQYELAQQPAQALALLEPVADVISDEHRTLELMALRLALLTQQKDRANLAARRLLASTVLPDDLESFSKQLIQLGQQEQAEQMLTRASGNTAVQFDVRPMQMDVLVEQGHKEQATSVALAILDQLDQRRPEAREFVAFQLKFIRTWNKVPVVANPEVIRKRCYVALSATGRLDEIIEMAEAELKQHPDSEPLIEKLMAYYSATRNQTRMDELAAYKLKLHADQSALHLDQSADPVAERFAVGLKYLQIGRPDDAVQQMTILLERDPANFADHCRATLHRFRGRKNLAEFAMLLNKLDWSRDDRRMSALPPLVLALYQRSASNEFAERVFLRAWEGAFDRPVPIRNAQEERKGILSHGWDEVFSTLAQNREMHLRIQTELERYSNANPHHLTPLILSAELWISTKDMNQAESSLARLGRFTNEHPLKTVDSPETKDANATADASQMALWLVARRCLGEPTLANQGEKLAERALEATRRSGQRSMTICLLEEWLSIAKRTDKTAVAERLTKELEALQKSP
jgi:tetratricopeptide (TPR) repeat protein